MKPWEMTKEEWGKSEIVDLKGYLPGLHKSYDFRLNLEGTHYIQRYGKSRASISKEGFHAHVILDAIKRNKHILHNVLAEYQDKAWAAGFLTDYPETKP